MESISFLVVLSSIILCSFYCFCLFFFFLLLLFLFFFLLLHFFRLQELPIGRHGEGCAVLAVPLDVSVEDEVCDVALPRVLDLVHALAQRVAVVALFHAHGVAEEHRAFVVQGRDEMHRDGVVQLIFGTKHLLQQQGIQRERSFIDGWHVVDVSSAFVVVKVILKIG